MEGDERTQPELGPIKDDVVEPALSFVERLRELYRHSGWASLQSFADAVGYSRGHVSRFLSGDRRPPSDFLDRLFAALEKRAGRPISETAQTSTRRLFYECIRTTRPHEYQVFELREELKSAYFDHQTAQQLAQDFDRDLSEARRELAEIKRKRRALEQAAAQHSELQKRLADEQSAYDATRQTLNDQIADLAEALRQAKLERDEARNRGEHLSEQLRVARIRAEDERQQRIDDQERRERELRDERERREALEATLAEVLRSLTEPSNPAPSSGMGQNEVPSWSSAITDAYDHSVTNDAMGLGHPIAPPNVQPSIGEVLAQARRTSGLTLEAVSTSASLQYSTVDAIERDDFDQCRGISPRGAIHAFARAVGLDPQPLVSRYLRQQSPDYSENPPANQFDYDHVPFASPTSGKASIAPRSTGPWDVTEVESPTAGRIDLGGLLVPGVEGMELRVEVAGEDVVAATVVLRDSAIQLQAFAAPRNDGIWDEVRSEIASGVTEQGGIAHEVDGALGWELQAQVPVHLPDQSGVQVVRFVGVDGPRWFLRGVISGQAATQPSRGTTLEAIFRDTVVVRGPLAMSPRDPILLRLPPGTRSDGDVGANSSQVE